MLLSLLLKRPGSFFVAALSTTGPQGQLQRHHRLIPRSPLFSTTTASRSDNHIENSDDGTMMTPQHHHQQQPYPQHPQSQQQQQQPTAMFNGVNLQYPGLQQIYYDPPLYSVDNFLTPEECQFLIDAANDSFTPAPVVGKGAGEVSHTQNIVHMLLG